MKRTILTAIFALLTFAIFAQSPLMINYQAVLRDNLGNIMLNENVSIDIKIIKGNIAGTEVFTETHSTSTNDYGAVNLVIGSIESLDGINWNDDNYFVQIWLDGTEMGTSQLLSVPYAMHSKTAENVENLNIVGDETAFDNWDKDASDDFSGDYNDLINQPTIPDAQNLSDVIAVNNSANGQIKDLADPTDAQDAATKAYVDELEERIAQIEALIGTSVVDYDGNLYRAVHIGTQVWMAENLKVTHYSDGTLIPMVTDLNSNASTDDEWLNLGDNNTDRGICYFEDNPLNPYGALYTYAAATNGDDSEINVQGACPDGWHIPSTDEWNTLIDFVENDGHAGSAGFALSSATGWDDENTRTDNYGFGVLPGGSRNHDDGNFMGEGTSCFMITASLTIGMEDIANGFVNFNTYSDGVSLSNYEKSRGYYIRCIRD